MLQESKTFITPNWPAPASIKAFTTTRLGGVSEAAYASFNLGDHVKDNPDAVKQNRAILAQRFPECANITWLQQVHGTNVICVDAIPQNNTADASISFMPKKVCAVLTADCLPVLVTDTDAKVVAAIHAGWRGLAAGVIEATLAKLNIAAHKTLIWLGPAIGPQAFEVGADVKDLFSSQDKNYAAAFTQIKADKWLTDMYYLAKLRLEKLKIDSIFGGEYCTYSDKEKFYSFRRDGDTGRMASIIWRED